MAWEGALHFLPGLQAATDMSPATTQFCFVQLDTVNNTKGGVVPAGTAGQKGIVGVLQDSPTLNQPALVAVGGVTKMRAGSALTAGTRIGSDANGQGIPASAVSTFNIYGFALETVAGAGSYFAMILKYEGDGAH